MIAHLKAHYDVVLYPNNIIHLRDTHLSILSSAQRYWFPNLLSNSRNIRKDDNISFEMRRKYTRTVRLTHTSGIIWSFRKIFAAGEKFQVNQFRILGRIEHKQIWIRGKYGQFPHFFTTFRTKFHYLSSTHNKFSTSSFFFVNIELYMFHSRFYSLFLWFKVFNSISIYYARAKPVAKIQRKLIFFGISECAFAYCLLTHCSASSMWLHHSNFHTLLTIE